MHKRFPIRTSAESNGSLNSIEKEKLAKLDKEFEEDIRKLRNRLQDLRKKLWEKNQLDLKLQIEQLKKEKAKMDAMVEENLVTQFTSYFKASHKNFIQQKSEICNVNNVKEHAL